VTDDDGRGAGGSGKRSSVTELGLAVGKIVPSGKRLTGIIFPTAS
jgi:hypothetical protein